MKHFLIIALAIGLTGCGVSQRLGLSRDATAVSLPYKTTLAVGEDKHDIAVTVAAPVGTGVEAVRESVRYPATRHCLETYGNSLANWQIDPATGDWAFGQAEGAMIFTARCQGR